MLVTDISEIVYQVELSKGILQYTSTSIKVIEPSLLCIQIIASIDVGEYKCYHSNALIGLMQIDKVSLIKLSKDQPKRIIDIKCWTEAKQYPYGCFTIEGSKQLLVIGWGNIIQLYNINAALDIIEPQSHIILKSTLVYISSLAEAILIGVRNDSSLEVLPTSEFVQAKYSPGSEISTKNTSALNLNSSIRFQKMEDNKGSNFNMSIYRSNCKLYILAKDKVCIVKLRKWRQYFDDLLKNGQWLDSFITGIYLYEGKITGFANVPAGTLERKQSLKHSLKDYMLHVLTNMSAKGEISKSKILIRSAIEFSLKVAIEECIFTEVVAIIGMDHLMECLEPYVNNNEIVSQILTIDAIDRMSKHWEGKCNLLESLLNKMNMKHLEYSELVKLCAQHKLYSVLAEQLIKLLLANSCALEGLELALQTLENEICLRKDSNIYNSIPTTYDKIFETTRMYIALTTIKLLADIMTEFYKDSSPIKIEYIAKVIEFATRKDILHMLMECCPSPTVFLLNLLHNPKLRALQNMPSILQSIAYFLTQLCSKCSELVRYHISLYFAKLISLQYAYIHIDAQIITSCIITLLNASYTTSSEEAILNLLDQPLSSQQYDQIISIASTTKL